MAALDRIQIKGFKSIRELDLELNALNVLIGANGSGKSNFIEVFELLNQIIEERLQNFVTKSGGADRLLYYGRKTTETIEIHISFGHNRNGYDVWLESTADNKLYFSDEECWFHDKEEHPERPLTVHLGSGHRETELISESRQHQFRGVIAYVINHIKSWKLYQFHDTSDSAKVKGTSNINDNVFLRPDAANLAAFLYLLRETRYEYYDRIVKTIRMVAPFFGDFNLHPTLLNPNTINLEWREKDSDAYFDASMLSDGTLRFMSMATLLLQPNLPATILIDEPELGLHPYAITTLAGLLRSTATKTQVIVATQSTPLVNQFAPENVIVVDRLDGQSQFKRLQQARIENWMDDYGLGELWEKNIIGGRPQR